MQLGRLYSYFLVFIQFLLISLLFVYANLNSLGFIQYLFIFIGLWIGDWALYVMRESKLRITPDVAKGAILIKRGPYKYLRHPMYSAVLIFSFGLLVSNFYQTTLVFFILLFITLSFKIHYEEKLLNKSFEKYKAYSKKTNKLIPFIY